MFAQQLDECFSVGCLLFRMQPAEFGKPCFAAVIVGKTSGRLQLANHRMECRTDMKRRALPMQRRVLARPQDLLKAMHRSRFADPRFPGDQHKLALARVPPGPAFEQDLNVGFASDQLGQSSLRPGHKAGGGARRCHLPDPLAGAEALECMTAQIDKFDGVAQQSRRLVRNQDRARMRYALQSRCEIWRFANDVVLRSTCEIPQNHPARSDANASLKAYVAWPSQRFDRLDSQQRTPYRSLRIVFMRLRKAKIGQQTIAEGTRGETAERGDLEAHRGMEPAYHDPQILGIQL